MVRVSSSSLSLQFIATLAVCSLFMDDDDEKPSGWFLCSRSEKSLERELRRAASLLKFTAATASLKDY